jgi:Leucine-rich repeat (LRR) protein
MKGRLNNALINWLTLIAKLTGGLILLVCLKIPPALAATNCTQVNQIPQSECNTLVILYKSTDGPNWNDSPDNNWYITNTPCDWAGITCSGRHVTEINREDKRLVGTLPNLSALTYLQSLDLGCYSWCNQLTGALPNLSALTKLTFLDLSGNEFSGTINISSLPRSLQKLYLADNQLEGAVPIFKDKFTSLTHLDLGGNYLTVPVEPTDPIDSHFPPTLEVLDLYRTSLNRPLSYLNLKILSDLTYLNLSSTQLSGTIYANYFPKSLTTL